MQWWDIEKIREGVPFAIDTAGIWRDVDEVPNGKRCGCYCGACRSPLVARQGEIRAHHFAHSDRRECRHALEASLFGMATKLLQEPGTTLRMPAEGHIVNLAASLGIPPHLLEKYPLKGAVIPERHIALEGAVFRAISLAQSEPDSPDIVLPAYNIAIHILSVRKSIKQATNAPRPSNTAVLALNLYAYARIWWDVCDRRKEERLREARQATHLMRAWLTQQSSGRGWVHHPGFEAERARLTSWYASRREEPATMPKYRPAPLTFRPRPRPEWLAPPHSAHPAPGASGWLATGAGVVPAPARFMKRVRSEYQHQIDTELEASGSIKWHAGRQQWFYVGEGGTEVPVRLRFLINPSDPWEPVTKKDGAQFTVVNRASTVPSVPPPTSISRPEVAPPEEAKINRLLAANVGTCYCGSLIDEVVLAAGYFAGRKARVCRRDARHPMKLLG